MLERLSEKLPCGHRKNVDFWKPGVFDWVQEFMETP